MKALVESQVAPSPSAVTPSISARWPLVYLHTYTYYTSTATPSLPPPLYCILSHSLSFSLFTILLSLLFERGAAPVLRAVQQRGAASKSCSLQQREPPARSKRTLLYIYIRIASFCLPLCESE